MTDVLLTGFMGVGKSTVGHELADRYGLQFVDTDREIERRAGCTIAEYWAAHDEPAFRTLEAEVFAGLAEGDGRVIATGAGALTFECNRAALGPDQHVVCLTAELDTLVARLAGERKTRPLLAGLEDAEVARYAEERLEGRRAAYDLYSQVDTTHLTPREAAEAVARRCGLRTAGELEFEQSTPSRVLFARGLLQSLGPAMREDGLEGAVLLVTDEQVERVGHASTVHLSLEQAGYQVQQCVVPTGEEYKTLESVQEIYRTALRCRLDRSATVVGVGGGVVGDMAGMVAATYLRGLSLVLAPTTLLAQVDAAIGGKVGVDLDGVKNMVGAFHPARIVAIDPDALTTLPVSGLADGLAEIIKIALMRSIELLARVEMMPGSHAIHQHPDIVRSAALEKVRLVREDPYEHGERVLLNFGHTIGHGLEAASGYRLSHGQAVSVGMVAETWLAERNGWCEAGVLDRLRRLLDQFDLPYTAPNLDPQRVREFVWQDKKRKGGAVRFAIPRSAGDGVVVEVGKEDVESAIERAIGTAQ